MSIAVLGSGAFGTALAVALGREARQVTLVARTAEKARALDAARESPALRGVVFPESLALADVPPAATDIVLLAVPMQSLSEALKAHAKSLDGRRLVACCKGVELGTGRLAHDVIADTVPGAIPALLSGPSFAVDIAAGLPTALTLAAADPRSAEDLQDRLSTATLRLYRTTDPIGVALGGALKNVIAIAAGMAIGAGMGESARAALITRGYAEIQRLAVARGARPETLAGLAGFGDLVLTCTSEKSRNYAYGRRLGHAGATEAIETTEGIATAQASAAISRELGVDMPITLAIASVLDGKRTVAEAADALLARPLRPE